MSSASIFNNFTQFNCNKSLIVITKQIEEGIYKEQVQQLRSLIADGKQTEADQLKNPCLHLLLPALLIKVARQNCYSNTANTSS